MRRFLLLLFVVFLSMTAFAQLEVKKGSFKEVPGFVNVNPDRNYQNDDNDLPFAVIKVRTENINERQRRELKFSGNGGTFIMLEYKDGEVWVYLTAKYADYLKISHPDLSSTEYTFPYDLKPKCGYEMTLVNTSPNIDKNNYLIIKVDQQNAKIFIDDELMGTGYASKVVSIGEEHRYKVSCDDYFPKEGLVYFDKREDKEISVNLEPNFGYITIKSDPAGADVYVDEVKVGVTPYLMKKIKPGDHVVELRKTGYESYADMVTILVREKNEQMESVVLVENKNAVQQVLSKDITKFANIFDDSSISNGVFSVSDTLKVHFSKGNLQYQASTNTWRFAEHQWDRIGKTNKNISSTYSGWIDLFGWGTSGYKGKDPWMTTMIETDYGEGFNDIAGTDYDWGIYITKTNGGGINWRTLTKDEWDYLFNKRNTSSGIRYAKAMVYGVRGVILLPDDWDIDTYNLKKTNKRGAGFGRNDISTTDWINKFEANGAVFLPCAGVRFEKWIPLTLINSGFYWSASLHDNGFAYQLHFDSLGLSANNPDVGNSVRLVCDVEE
ncbi:MAG: PEGA domain-containing protein [Bacteroidales bacterium]|nr:PEGA domain-containing protein [Bacteroidales bacterium]